jgi:hypothetical protein
VRDRRAERRLTLGALDVDVDPLVIARGLGKQVHLLLRDLDQSLTATSWPCSDSSSSSDAMVRMLVSLSFLSFFLL